MSTLSVIRRSLAKAGGRTPVSREDPEYLSRDGGERRAEPGGPALAELRARIPRAANRVISIVDLTCQALLSVMVIACVGMVFSSVVARFITGVGFLWADSVTEVFLASIAFLGSVTSLSHDEHVAMRTFQRRLSDRAKGEAAVIEKIVVIVFSAVVAWQAVELAVAPNLGTFPDVDWPANVVYIPLAIGAILLMIVAAAQLLVQLCIRMAWYGLGISVAAGAVFWLVIGQLRGVEQLSGNITILVTFIVFVAALILGVPMAFAIGGAAAVGILTVQAFDLSAIPLQMNNSVITFTMIAVPFFILVGGLLGVEGVSTRMMRIMKRLASRLAGGERVAAIIGMFVFAGMSGSKMADIAAVAPAFRTSDEDVTGEVAELRAARSAEATADEPASVPTTGPEVASIFNASAVMGETIPPSISMLVLCSITTVSASALFAGGLLPACLIGLCLATLAVVRAVRSRRKSSALPPTGQPSAAAPSRHFIYDVIQAIPILGALIIIAVPIVGGYATPSEASAIAVVYTFLVVCVIYRVKPGSLLTAINRSARLAGMLLFVIACAGAFSWLLTSAGITQEIVRFASAIGNARIPFILLSIVMLAVLGSVFEGMPALLIFGPVFVPEAAQLGINVVQYSVVFLMSLGVGAFIPPLGVGYYASCAITGVDPDKAVKTTYIYMSAAVVGIILVGFVPGVTTYLPHLLGIRA